MFLPLFLLAAATPEALPAPLLAEPALSPNHQEIAFASGGDIWTVPATGGEARLLISHPATESRPLYSPDGTRLAFLSTRTGIADIYVLELRDGTLKRLTFDDTRNSLDAWSPDGRFLYYSSSRGDINAMNDIYKIPATGGTPTAVTADRFADESQAAPNPVNATIAFLSGGVAVSQWWRKGHAHIDETRLTLLTTGAVPQFTPLLENHAKNLWPMWSADGQRLYFMSDQSGTENIWSLTPGGKPQQITKFTDGRVLWPGISNDGKAMVFERNFVLWSLDPATGKTAPIPITLRGVPAGPSTTHLTLNNQFRNLHLSPDGKKAGLRRARTNLRGIVQRRRQRCPRHAKQCANEKDLAWAP